MCSSVLLSSHIYIEILGNLILKRSWFFCSMQIKTRAPQNYTQSRSVLNPFSLIIRFHQTIWNTRTCPPTSVLNSLFASRDLPADPRQTDGQCASRHLLPPVLAVCRQLQRGAGGVSHDEEGLWDGGHRQTGQNRYVQYLQSTYEFQTWIDRADWWSMMHIFWFQFEQTKCVQYCDTVYQ